MTDEKTIPLEDLVETVNGGSETVEEAVERLAALDPIAYDRVREEEAKRIECRLGTLDRAVSRRRPKAPNADNDDGAGLGLFEPEPWLDPVDGVDMLDQLVAVIKRYLVLEDHAAEAIALWVLHTYAHDTAFISPRLAFLSPDKRCGKTTALMVVQHLVWKALPAANITAAALFRSIEAASPTLCIDEADTFLRDNDELRGILNSGHNRANAFVIRVTGEEHTPAQFRTWAPVAIAMIGNLPDTLADGSKPSSSDSRAALRAAPSCLVNLRADHCFASVSLSQVTARALDCSLANPAGEKCSGLMRATRSRCSL